MAILFFLYFSFVITASAIVTILARSVIHSAMALLVAFVHIAGIYILLNAEFLAAVQLIVYTGAILVLYLFVIMLFNIKTLKTSFQKQVPFVIFLSVIVLFELMMILNNGWFAISTGENPAEQVSAVGNTKAIGMLLYTKFLYPFEVASIILLVALVGAILLSLRLKEKKAVPVSRGVQES